MATKIFKKKDTGNSKQTKRPIPVNAVPPTAANEPEFKNIHVGDIDFSPLNYRRFFSQKSLEDFAGELALHGIISPLTLRPIPSGRYELVAGERRLRAAIIAKLKEIPATIKTLTDEEVIEIQLAENLQREDPHPMHEAQGIGQMLKTRKSIDEISARLGKSKTFVYSRIKLLSLIEPVQEMFLADAINMQQAFEIAAVSAESQQEFFEQYCSEWKEDKEFELDNLLYVLSKFKYDLNEAPFNIKDKKLLPEAGACTSCPSNTATLKTLFPEYAKQAVCTNKECYHKKCAVHFSFELISAFHQHKPDAFLFNGDPSEMLKDILPLLPHAEKISAYNRHEITVMGSPRMPDREDYSNEWETEEGEEPEFDQEGYDQAMEEYKMELEEYSLLLQSGKLLKGLLVTENRIELLSFSLERQQTGNSRPAVTAKEVQAAIKSGTASKALLQAEIDRINSKEIRSIEIDREKIQLTVHQKFNEQLSEISNNAELTATDLVAARLIIYQSLDYTTRRKVTSALFGDKEDRDNLYGLLAGLTDQQYCYLIRMSVAGNSESKYPNNDTGFFLRKVAESAGTDITSIERRQQQKAETRQSKQKERIEDLEKKISKLKHAE
jgi:ParB family transcriptional regulator, chromosome partitioning protein